eukprot:1158780-Pelagomonas_calceolata.AAC.17
MHVRSSAAYSTSPWHAPVVEACGHHFCWKRLADPKESTLCIGFLPAGLAIGVSTRECPQASCKAQMSPQSISFIRGHLMT